MEVGDFCETRCLGAELMARLDFMYDWTPIDLLVTTVKTLGASASRACSLIQRPIMGVKR